MARLSQLLAASALALLAACQGLEPAAVRTDRAAAQSLARPGEEASFHFAIFGDRTAGPERGLETLRQAVAETNLIAPDFVMTVGDLVPGYNRTPQWLEEMRAYQAVMADLAAPWYPVAGNHDVYWKGSEPPPGQHEADYETHFGPLWYWFPHKNAAFIVLYSDEGDPQSNRKGFADPALIQMSQAQLAWLEETLKETASYDQVFVFLHHPRWIATRYKGGNWQSVHRLLAAAGNVSAVFAGHIHRQRYDGLRDGIAYFTLATIGGSMPMDVPGSGWLNHSLMVTVRGASFEVATIPVGVVRDPEDMTPERLNDLDRARQVAIERLSGAIPLAADGAANGEIRYRVRNDAALPVEVEVGFAEQAGDWWVRPDRLSLELAPQASEEIALAVRRDADGFAGPVSIPTLAFQLSVEAAGEPVSFPESYAVAPVRPALADAPAAPRPDERALALDGNGAGLWFDPDAIEIESAPFTLEARVRARAPNATGVLIGKYHDTGYALMLMDGRPQFVVGLPGAQINLRPADEAAEKAVVEPGAWHHVAAVFDQGQARLYLDGELVGRAEAPPEKAFEANDLPLFVGGNAIWDGKVEFAFEGDIDELRISTVARYQGDAFAPVRRFEPDEATALLLHLDGDGGPFARDAAARRRHGLAIGDVRYVAP